MPLVNNHGHTYCAEPHAFWRDGNHGHKPRLVEVQDNHGGGVRLNSNLWSSHTSEGSTLSQRRVTWPPFAPTRYRYWFASCLLTSGQSCAKLFHWRVP
jgi:hypothetical protein